ncbi:hypothetical protein AOC36_04640 [Erysipelothrix larvae]|uniref:Uncharacterized protein n=1 Tax=Erysipelothrix larvae TaxID=1514105 RepID=A0A0X8GZU7_9FIRM|nr:hypothetical protein [Erysipelothrix larvae]AMC93284.1 hypothetical protein AOC36_04640 [Erysipelothrix larvae]
MQRIWALSKVMLKSSLDEQFNAFKGKKNSGIKSILLFGFLGIYIGGVILFLGTLFLSSLISVGQPSLFIFLLNLFMPMVILFFTIFSVPIILYYSSDNASYFVLPLKPSEIIAGKSIAIYVQTFITVLAVLLPLYILYFIKVDVSFLSMVLALLSIFIVPILPILVSVILIVLIFTFTPFFRNKETFTYVSQIIAVVLSLGLSQISVFMDANSLSIESIIDAIQNQNDTIFTMLSSAFPTTRFISDAIVNQSMSSFVLALLISVIAAFVVFKITEPLYFKTVLLFTESKRSNRRISLNQLTKESNQKNIIVSFMQYDFRNILRTPAFVSNYYIPYLLIPVMMGFGAYSAIRELGSLPINEIQTVVQPIISNFSSLELIVFMYMLSLIVGLFFVNLGNPTSTLISREGINVTEFLTFPIQLSSIIKAKILNGLVPAIPLPIIILCLAVIILGLPLYLIPFIFLGVIVGGAYVTSIGSWVDMASPRLKWVNEHDAVKGNLRQVFVILPFMFIPFVIGIILVNTQSLIIWGLISIFTLLGIVVLIKHVLTFADNRLASILQNK